MKSIGNSKNLKSIGFIKLPNRVIWAKRAPKNEITIILTMEKISAQFEAQTRQNRQLQLGQPITRNIESDPNIRSNMSSKFSNPIQPG